MLVGQNPGAEEDVVGRPFVGRAGRFLDGVLSENGFCRSELYVTNVVKHRTPRNRIPKQDEVAACMPYLMQEIVLVKPKIVVLMGRIAWQVPRASRAFYVETFHPSAAMRFPRVRRRFVSDFRRLKSLFNST
jgi:DNA polymerase